MADYYAVDHMAAFVTVPPTNAEPRNAHGRVRVLWDAYTIVGATTYSSADTIYMGGKKIPKGARIIDGWVASPDYGGTATLLVRVRDSTTHTLIAAFDASGQAAHERFGAAAADKLNILDLVMDQEGQIEVVPSGDLVNSVAFAVVVYYVID